MKPTQLVQAARLIHLAFGWKGIARRAAYVAQLRSGLIARQTPMGPDFSDSPRVAWDHRFDLDAIREQYEELADLDGLRTAVVERADRILGGELELYGWTWRKVDWPPRWHRNDWTGYEYPRVHWPEISDNDPEVGDIKDVWELSRLPFTATFARAYVLTGDDRYPEAWWQAVEDWAVDNPPNVGVNWRCGQESSLRGMALCFGLSAFAEHPSSTPARTELAQRILGATVARVRPTLRYALSQRNNHAISELVFLLSVRADGERQLHRLLLEVLDDQFYDDGSYSQQSFTYQRLAVQTLAWLLVTRPGIGSDLRDRVVQCLADSREFLGRCSDPVSGWLPNYGANDGTLLFDLTIADYRSFSSLLSMLGRSPDDSHHGESAIWQPLPAVTTCTSRANSAPTTYHTLRGPQSLLFMRAGRGRHRPAHADQQAVDLWLDGDNVIRDPGTYRYTAPDPWGNPLTAQKAHSGPILPKSTGMQIGRFLFEGGPPAEVVHRGGPKPETLAVRRPAPDGQVVRAVARDGDCYAIMDIARGLTVDVRWNLMVGTSCISFLGPQPTPRSNDADPLGSESPYYAQRRAMPALNVKVGSVAFAFAGTTHCEHHDHHSLLAALADWLTPREQSRISARLARQSAGNVQGPETPPPPAADK